MRWAQPEDIMATSPSTDTLVRGPHFDSLKASFGGRFFVPSEPDYEAARRTWNGSIDRHPALIAQCSGRDDVVAAVRFAAETGALVAVKAGGHSLPGYSSCDGGLVIDLSGLRQVVVDAGRRLSVVDPGATWADLDAATHQLGLATTGGLISHTGVAGLTLGGGIGWLMRQYGLSCDNLAAAEVVTAGGEVVRASETENADLLWGLRGGGGNFGVVTSFELRVHPVAEVLGGLALFPLDRGPEILRRYRDWQGSLPDAMTTMAVLLFAPPEPFVPPEMVGRPAVAVLACHCDDPDAGRALLAPIAELGPAVEMFTPMPYPALQGMLDAGAPPGLQNYFRAGYLKAIDDGFIDTALDQFSRAPFPMDALHLHQLGGAVGRVPSESTAFGNRDAAFAYNIIATSPDPTLNEEQVSWARQMAAALEPFSTGGVYVNFLGDEGEGRVRAAYGASRYDRLVGLKDRYDPGNLFRLNQNIRPSRPSS
jgi:FAD/FMN-containing dehydrogenase